MRIWKSALFTTLAIALSTGAVRAARPMSMQSVPQVAPAPGTAEAGGRLWANRTRYRCSECHGPNGEGGFGPDLARRGLSVEQFTRAVREPWGIMPAFTETQLSDQDLTAMVRWLETQPQVTTPAAWRITAPPNAPAGQLLMVNIGCGQCHEADMGRARMIMGGVAPDYSWFIERVYRHTTWFPRGVMGNYSPTRVPESTLREIWQFVEQLGLRPNIGGTIAAGPTDAAGAAYTLTVANNGMPQKGLIAEEVSVALELPASATVVQTVGERLQGVRSTTDGRQVVEWTIPRLAPGDKSTYSVVLSGTGAPLQAQVRWTKPVVDTWTIAAPAPASRDQ